MPQGPDPMQKTVTWYALIMIACLCSLTVLFGQHEAADVDVAVSDDLDEDDARFAGVAKTFFVKMPELHLSRGKIDDAISRFAFELYLNALDYEKAYFTAEDIERFGKERSELDDHLKAGDFSFPVDVFSTFTNRMHGRHAYLTNLLATHEFDLDLDEGYAWKRKDAAWTASADMDDFWRRKIKNEYINRVLNNEAAEALRASVTNVLENGDIKIAPHADIKGVPKGANPKKKDASDNADSKKKDVSDDDDSEKDKVVEPVVPIDPVEAILKRYGQYRNVIASYDKDWIVQKFMSAFAQSFDPHTDYMSPSSQADFDIQMSLKLVGIGAILSPEDGAAKVVQVVVGGPADMQGDLAAGDRIIAVGQEGDDEPESVLHWPLRKTVQKIRGEIDTTVTLVVLPASDPSGATTKTFSIKRGEVKLEEQAASGRVLTVPAREGVSEREFGVITLPAFYVDIRAKQNKDPDYRSSRRDIEKQLGEMVEKNVDGIILDLRNNGGGSLVEAIEMTGLFFKLGPVVQVSESRGGISPLWDRNPDVTYAGPLVVLVNRLSASASEILAAALQDYGRAVIVGDSKTHGKGSVQSVVDMHNDPKKRYGSLKVTTASFYRIAGGSTQLKGVSPDITVSSAYDTMDVGEEFLKHALPWTQMPQARGYRPVMDMKALIPKLTEISRARRDDDDRYKTRRELLKSLQRLRDRDEVSLNIDVRRKQISSEKDLRDLQEKLFKEAEADGEDNEDLVLWESMHILSDFIDMTRRVD